MVPAHNVEAPDEAEKALVEKLQAGDNIAWKEWYAEMYPMLVSFALRFCKGHAEAADLAHETLKKASSGIHAFRSDSKLTTWLHRIAHRTVVNRYWFLRRRGEEFKVELDADTPEALSLHERVADPHSTQEQVASAKEDLKVILNLATEVLSPEYRDIFQMWLDDSTYIEISEKHKIGIGTVKSRINRIVRHVRAAFSLYQKDGRLNLGRAGNRSPSSERNSPLMDTPEPREKITWDDTEIEAVVNRTAELRLKNLGMSLKEVIYAAEEEVLPAHRVRKPPAVSAYGTRFSKALELKLTLVGSKAHRLIYDNATAEHVAIPRRTPTIHQEPEITPELTRRVLDSMDPKMLVGEAHFRLLKFAVG